MDSSGIMHGARSLLQKNETYHTNTPEGCKGVTCLLFHILTITGLLLVILTIVGVVWYKQWKLSRAVQKGSVPAEMLISYWGVKPSERGDIDAFTFPVHRPARREDINEEACPVCLKDRPKSKSWVVFEGCHHAVCLSCFKKIVGQHRLHVACPMCRSLLAIGEGDRGGPAAKPAAEQQPTEEQAAEEQPAPPRLDNNNDQV